MVYGPVLAGIMGEHCPLAEPHSLKGEGCGCVPPSSKLVLMSMLVVKSPEKLTLCTRESGRPVKQFLCHHCASAVSFHHFCIRSALSLLPFKMGYNDEEEEKEGTHSDGMALHGFAEDCRMGIGIAVYRAILSPTAESRCTAKQLVLFTTLYSAIFCSIGCTTQFGSTKL